MMNLNQNLLPLLISLSGAFLVFFVQQFLRVHLHLSGPAAVFFGSAPNLIVGIWFPFSILIRPRAFAKRQAERFFRLWCAGTFLLLVGFEILRPFKGAQTFDYFDILASGAGVVVAFLIYHLYLGQRLVFGEESLEAADLPPGVEVVRGDPAVPETLGADRFHR